jgi:hypothetical protein
MEFNFNASNVYCDVDFDADLQFDAEPSFTFDENYESSSFHQIVCDTRRDISDQEPIKTFPFYFGNKCPYSDIDFIMDYQAKATKEATKQEKEATKEATKQEKQAKQEKQEKQAKEAKQEKQVKRQAKEAKLLQKKNNKKFKKSDPDTFLNFRKIAPKCM